ncbi:winged helix-turn-helix transcriptional regulator [Streptomyces olivaceus]|uniref:winged helix-turn-helix transcriptional regulator n=1 Tax=Streptomyces olivaceus TaxID=47716 RepID=UPI001CCE359D|nr:winged helix-turn-helix transcriptional regulator [Streptomyces olivaceus]
MVEAERVEDALHRSHLRHSPAVIEALDSADGPMRFVHIAEAAHLDNGLARQRLLRLQTDGLVTRTGSRHGDPYVLTDAGQALGAVYASAESWSQPFALRGGTAAPRPAAAATRTHVGIPLGAEADSARTAAALRRSAAASNVMFSHAPQPEPRVPAAVTAQSAPGRGR